MGVEKEIGDVGALKHDGTFPHFATITSHAFNLECWGCSIIPT
jgi:hypothetical protein